MSMHSIFVRIFKTAEQILFYVATRIFLAVDKVMRRIPDIGEEAT